MSEVNITEILSSGLKYVEQIKGNKSLISNEYFAGNEEQACKNLEDFIEGMNWLEQAVVLLELERDEEQKDQIVSFCEGLNISMKNGDWVSLIDMINYELEDVLDIYGNVFQQKLNAVGDRHELSQ